MRIEITTCRQCGKTFERGRSGLKKIERRIFCGSDCRIKGRQQLGAAASREAKSSPWHLKSPRNVRISGMGLPRIIADNAHLFSPDDLVPRGKCMVSRAEAGLYHLRRKALSWKGWTLDTGATQ